MKRYFKPLHLFCIFAMAAMLCVCSFVTANAADNNTVDPTIKDITLTPAFGVYKDGNVNTFGTTSTVTITSNTVIDSLYVVFWSEASDIKLSFDGKEHTIENDFLQCWFKLPEEFENCKSLKLTFNKALNVSEVNAFTEGKLPDWVHVWKSPYDKADLLLVSTHADDEQLFFAGVLPYHVAKGYRVQVAYFTDHTNGFGRRHELLNGLWTVGVDHYPVISKIPDAYSTTEAAAIANMNWAGIKEDYAIGFQTELLRRFKPQVVIEHDLKGEYGHGQHMLNVQTMIKAVGLAGDAKNYPESADKYGVWETPKLYVHMYTENKVTMNWDEPLDYFGGKSAFQMTQLGYKNHASQQYTWFTAWLNGNNNNITKATQITTYSPCDYGLYRTTVGNDVEKNSFFENLVSYDEQYRLEQERLEQERLEQEEQKRKEEESKRLEEESKRLEAEAEASRQEESRQEASRQEASRKEELEQQKELAKNEKSNNQAFGVVAIVVLVAAVVMLGAVLVKKIKE